MVLSDGLIETINHEEEEFGLQRLRMLLTSLPAAANVENISGAILRATDEYTGEGRPAHDDRTLVVVRVRADYAQALPSLPVIY